MDSPCGPSRSPARTIVLLPLDRARGWARGTMGDLRNAVPHLDAPPMGVRGKVLKRARQSERRRYRVSRRRAARRMAMEPLASYCVIYDANRTDHHAAPVDVAAYMLQNVPSISSAADCARYIAHFPARDSPDVANRRPACAPCSDTNSPDVAKPLPYAHWLATQTRHMWRIAAQ
jgi:hypothetical protein